MAAWFDGAHVPLRCTRITASKSASDMFQMAASRTMPALLTSTSSRPQVSTACCDHLAGAVVVGHVVVVGHGLAAALVDDVDREVGVLAGPLARAPTSRGR